MNKKLVIEITIVLILISIAVFSYTNIKKNSGNFAKPIGILNTNQNEELKSNINTFMESQVSEYDIGKENYFCSNSLYGYDDKYAYARVYCQGFEKNISGELELGTGFSNHIRLEYRQPNFQIIDFKKPGDAGLKPTLQQLFPKKLSQRADQRVDLANDEFNKLDNQVKRKVKTVMQIKAKYPELKDYPSDKLPPRSIVVEQEQNNLYVAFIQNGSGRPILGARCFLVKSDNTIVANGNFTPNSVNDNDLSFSAKECKSINQNIIESTETPIRDAKAINILYPKGGEQLQSGEIYKIKWNSSADKVSIRLISKDDLDCSIDPRSANCYFAYSSNTDEFDNKGFYNLEIPVKFSGEFKIEITEDIFTSTMSNYFTVNLTRNPNPQLWSKNTPPTFSDFPATLYQGDLKDVDLKSHPDAYYFRTRLKSIDNTSPVGFAGKYTMAEWGCGRGCRTGVVVDRTNGKVETWIPTSEQRGKNYEATSTLFILNQALDPEIPFADIDPSSFNVYAPVQYYVWDGKQFVLIYQEECTLTNTKIPVCK